MNATKPTLIVTLLYNPKAESETYLTNRDIYDKLLKHLARSKEAGGLALSQAAHQRYFRNREASIFVVPFAANELKHLELTDIALVQVGININLSPLELGGSFRGGGDVVTGWCEAEERLAQAMKGLPSEVEKAFVGRTIVYAATMPADADADKLSQALLNQLRLQEKHEHLPHKAVAASPLMLGGKEGGHGKLWLLKSGRSGDANIYMALEAEAEENPFKTKTLFGNQAILIYPDTIAHKAYYMARDYTLGNTRPLFREASNALMEKTIETLAQTSSSALAQRANQPLVAAPPPAHADHASSRLTVRLQLNALSKQAAKLTTVSASLRQLHSRLKIHQFNYQLASEREPQLGDIAIYHQQQQKKILFRLSEDLTDATAALDATNTALNYLRADYERQQAEQTKQLRQQAEQHAMQNTKAEQRTQQMLAIMTVALTVAQIVGRLPISWQLVAVISSGLITWLLIQRVRG